MQSGNALTFFSGLTGLLLIAAMLCAVIAARMWRSAKAKTDLHDQAEMPDDDSPSEDELDLASIPARGLRRATRGPRLFDQAQQERLIREMAFSARGKARAARGKSSKVA
jgi:hypothetical protein